MKKKEFEFVFDFGSIAERNEFLAKQYPERKCSDTPGVFEIKGGSLAVRFERVTVTTTRKAPISGADCVDWLSEWLHGIRIILLDVKGGGDVE